MQKTLDYSIHSSKKHRQYESNKVNNTASKHNTRFVQETRKPAVADKPARRGVM